MLGLISNFSWTGTLLWTCSHCYCQKSQPSVVGFPSPPSGMTEMLCLFLNYLVWNLRIYVCPWVVGSRGVKSYIGVSFEFVWNLKYENDTFKISKMIVFGILCSCQTYLSFQSMRRLALIALLHRMKWAILFIHSITMGIMSMLLNSKKLVIRSYPMSVQGPAGSGSWPWVPHVLWITDFTCWHQSHVVMYWFSQAIWECCIAGI